MTVFEDVLRDVAKESVSPLTLRKTYPAYLVFVVLLLITLVAWRVIDNIVESEHRTTFEKAAESIVTRLTQAVTVHENVVRSIRELFGGSLFIVRDVFEFYGSIAPKTFPSVRSVAFVPKVDKQEMPRFIWYAKSERYYDYRLQPDTVYPVNYPVFYIVPLEQNQSQLGKNLVVQPSSRSAIERALQTESAITVTPVVQLRPDTLGFRLFAHVYNRSVIQLPLAQEEMEGVVMVEVLAAEFFRYAFREMAPTDTLVTFAVLQTQQDGQWDTIFASPNAGGQVVYQPKFSERYVVPIGDQQWSVVVQTVPQFGRSFFAYTPEITLAGGMLLSIAVFAFVLSLLTSRAIAENLASRMTAAQRRILTASNDMIGVMTVETEVLGMNQAVERILQYRVEEIINRPLLEFIDPRDRKRFQQELSAAQDEVPVVIDVRMQARDGEQRWVSWNCTVSRTDGVVYIIGRDVTLQKQAEEELKLWNKQLELARLDVEATAVQQQRLVEQMGQYFTTNLFRLREVLETLQYSTTIDEREREVLLRQAFEEAQELMGNVGELISSVEKQTEAQEPRRFVSLHPEVVDLIQQLVKTTGMAPWEIQEHPLLKQFAIYVNPTAFQQALQELFQIAAARELEGSVFFELNPYDRVLEMQILLSYDAELATAVKEIHQATTPEQLRALLRQDSGEIRFALLHATKLIEVQGGYLKIDVLGTEGILIVLSTNIQPLPQEESQTESFSPSS